MPEPAAVVGNATKPLLQNPVHNYFWLFVLAGPR